MASPELVVVTIEKKQCFGQCYHCYPTSCCPTTFHEYWNSGYVQTSSGYGSLAEEKNSIFCFCCFPIKFALFFSCCFGSLCNEALNRCKKTSNKNYLI